MFPAKITVGRLLNFHRCCGLLGNDATHPRAYCDGEKKARLFDKKTIDDTKISVYCFMIVIMARNEFFMTSAALETSLENCERGEKSLPPTRWSFATS